MKVTAVLGLVKCMVMIWRFDAMYKQTMDTVKGIGMGVGAGAAGRAGPAGGGGPRAPGPRPAPGSRRCVRQTEQHCSSQNQSSR